MTKRNPPKPYAKYPQPVRRMLMRRDAEIARLSQRVNQLEAMQASSKSIILDTREDHRRLAAELAAIRRGPTLRTQVSEPLPPVETTAGPTWMGVTVAATDPDPGVPPPSRDVEGGMNQRQLDILREMLADTRRHVDNMLRVLDAGMVVVGAEPYCDGYQSATRCYFDMAGHNCDEWWDWVYVPPTSHPACNPSHLTIADGRGEGAVGVDCREYVVWPPFHRWAGPDYHLMKIAWYDSVVVSPNAWAFCAGVGISPGTVLDCMTAHTSMTWRAA